MQAPAGITAAIACFSSRASVAAPSPPPVNEYISARRASSHRWLPGITLVAPLASVNASTATIVESEIIGRGCGRWWNESSLWNGCGVSPG